MVERRRLYSIGQTAKICEISIQTLHFYDKIGLVKPAEVDPINGYRFYSNQDMMQIKIIQDLRSLHFSLDEISDMLKRWTTDHIVRMMRSKKEEAFEKLRMLEASIATIDKRIEHFEMQQTLRRTFEQVDVYIEFKKLPDRFVISERKRYACDFDAYTLRFTELFGQLKRQGIEPSGNIMTIYHESILEFDRSDADLECCIPIAAAAENDPMMRIIPGGFFLCASYCGIRNEASCKDVYTSLLAWMSDNGYAENGSVIEQYVMEFANIIHPEEMIVEMQIPVKKVLTL